MDLFNMNYQSEEIIDLFSTEIKKILTNDIVVVCIGTDKVIGDSLGPLVGTMLENSGFKFPVYGTSKKPVHALNIHQSIDTIYKNHPYSTIIAIDAALGKEENVGNIKLKYGDICPGKGVGKKLPTIGDYSIIGVVNKLNSTADDLKKMSLAYILEFAKIISMSIIMACD